MDMEGARRRSHEPTAVLQELGLGWPESTWLDRDKMPGRVTRLLRMEWGEGHWPGAVGPGRRRRLAVDRAEPGHESQATIQDAASEVGHA